MRQKGAGSMSEIGTNKTEHQCALEVKLTSWSSGGAPGALQRAQREGVWEPAPPPTPLQGHISMWPACE